MSKPVEEASETAGAAPSTHFALDEEFLQRVDRVMLRRKQTDPFQLEAVWRATEEEARMRCLQWPDEDRAHRLPR